MAGQTYNEVMDRYYSNQLFVEIRERLGIVDEPVAEEQRGVTSAGSTDMANGSGGSEIPIGDWTMSYAWSSEEELHQQQKEIVKKIFKNAKKANEYYLSLL